MPLSTEILQTVFRMVHVPFSDDVHDAQDRMRLGLVCRRWREIAIGDTAIWYDVNDLIGGDEAFSAIVARSGERLLSVRLTRSHGVYTEIQNLLGDAVPRLERFEIVSAECVTWRWMPLFRASLPRLRHVLIQTTHPCALVGSAVLNFDPATFFATCLSLESLFLHNVSWDLATFYIPTTLKTLSMEFTERSSTFSEFLTPVVPSHSDFWFDEPLNYKVPHVTNILQWLVQIPWLENVSIGGVFPGGMSDAILDWDNRDDAVDLTTLKVLYLRGALPGMKRFLHSIRTPTLLELALMPSSFDRPPDILHAAPPRLLARPVYLTSTVTLTTNDTVAPGDTYCCTPMHLALCDTAASGGGGVLDVHIQAHGEQGVHTFLTSPIFSINSLVISHRRIEGISPLTVTQWQDIGSAQASLEELSIPFMMGWTINLGEAMMAGLKTGGLLWPELRAVKFGGTILADVDEAMAWTIWLRTLCSRRRSGTSFTVMIGGGILTARTVEGILDMVPRAAHAHLIDLAVLQND